MIGLYVYKDTCPYSIKYRPIWNSFAQLTQFPCKDIEISSRYGGKDIVSIINSLKYKNIIDTKPAILFFDTNKKQIYLSVKRPVTIDSLKEVAEYIQTGNGNCTVLNNDLIDNSNRRSIIDKHESDHNTIFLF